MNQKSEHEIFNQLFANYRKPFIRFANSYLRNTPIAEDFTIDAFMGYWENRHSLSTDANLPAYILTILKNKCLNYLQHTQIHNETIEKLKELSERELNARIASLQSCDPEELLSTEVQEIVKKTLEKLPQKTQLIFQMSREQNLFHSEIAKLTNLSNKSIEFHISKAIKALRISLKEYLMSFSFLFC